jgi:hypothetical protein
MEKLCQIKIEIQGYWCHQWPKMQVRLNDHIYFDSSIMDYTTVEFTAPINTNNILIIQHYDKKFGQNGQWDTVSNDGTIVQDRALKLISLQLDSVDISEYIFKNCPLITEHKEVVNTDYYGFNGDVRINFDYPVYNWVIDNIIKPKSKISSDLSQAIETSYNNLFDYQQDLIELAEIENILNQNAHLFNKSS